MSDYTIKWDEPYRVEPQIWVPQTKGSMLAGLVNCPSMESNRRSLQSEEIHLGN